MSLRGLFIALIAALMLGFPLVACAQVEKVEEAIEGIERVIRRALPPAVEPADAPDEETPAEPAAPEKEEPEPVRKPRAPLPPKFMLLKLHDGSTIAGDLSMNEIKVKTEFGELVVPISKIKSFTPGLDSNVKAAEEIQAKIKDLESDDYQTREQARKDLAGMGPKISRQLAPHLSSENVEVKRHITEIMKEFEQLAEEASEDDEGDAQANKAWINEDTIETSDFTVTGKISPPEFKITSKYGPLSIALGDIVLASRPMDVRDSIRRNVTVPGQNLAQRGFKATGIRVQAGDRVTITASGNITMTPWGTNASSGPDGMPNYGWYVQGSIPGGSLVYRIGDKGPIHKAGVRVSFTAKTSGTLQLAIGMMPEYANEGYNFPGEYKTKVKVDPQ